MDVCLVGVSFDTGNMGVSALAESSIKLILKSYPHANVRLLDGRDECERKIMLFDREVVVENIPLRFCKNVLLPNHYCRYFLHAVLSKLLPSERLRRRLAARNTHVKMIRDATVVVDVGAGDSFSDIYGVLRFLRHFLIRWLLVVFEKKLIMFPQTYGPFDHSLTRKLAKHILKHSSKIYSRDAGGLEYVKALLGQANGEKGIEFCPDVAFILDAHRPKEFDWTLLDKTRGGGCSSLVGINVSGLLANGGYTRKNMFGLSVDYQEMVCGVIDLLLQNEDVAVLLVPHVFAPEGAVESDPQACRRIYDTVRIKHGDRVLLLEGTFNQNEIKYLIGMCSLFIGSRMHSCIAALSQCIPAVGLAYSRKFQGVFESIGVQQCAVDLSDTTMDDVLKTVDGAFKERKAIATHLQGVVPGIQAQVLRMFDSVS